MFQNHTHDHNDRRRHRRDPRHGPDGSPFGFREPSAAVVAAAAWCAGARSVPSSSPSSPLKPTHGYEVITELEAQSGGRWRPSAGSVYPTLQQLADEGLVTSEESTGGASTP